MRFILHVFFNCFHIDPYYLQIELIGHPLPYDIDRFCPRWAIGFQYFVDAMKGDFKIPVVAFFPEVVHDLLFVHGAFVSVGNEVLDQLNGLIPPPLFRCDLLPFTYQGKLPQRLELDRCFPLELLAAR